MILRVKTVVVNIRGGRGERRVGGRYVDNVDVDYTYIL